MSVVKIFETGAGHARSCRRWRLRYPVTEGGPCWADGIGGAGRAEIKFAKRAPDLNRRPWHRAIRTSVIATATNVPPIPQIQVPNTIATKTPSGPSVDRLPAIVSVTRLPSVKLKAASANGATFDWVA